MAALPGGGFLIADSLNARVRRVGPDGVIRTVAGTGENRFGLDGGLAADTPLSIPRDVEAVPGGGFLIAESGTHRIRWVAPNGVITTLAGTGTRGSTGDGGPARSARIATPFGVNMSPGGDVYISGPGLDDPDPANYRVRRIEGPLPAPPPLPGPTTPTGHLPGSRRLRSRPPPSRLHRRRAPATPPRRRRVPSPRRRGPSPSVCR